MTIFVGITGGIATGKSTIVKFLQKKGYKVHDSDLIVKKIYSQPNKKLFSTLKKIGLSSSIKNKQIDKKVIRDEIFTNKVKKKKLEKFIHKEVRISRNLFIKKHKNKKNKIIFFDIPLLFETNRENEFDFIILTVCSQEAQLSRLMKRDGLPQAEALKRLSAQLPPSQKILENMI